MELRPCLRPEPPSLGTLDLVAVRSHSSARPNHSSGLSVPSFIQPTQCVQLVVDDGLIQVIRFETESFDLFGCSLFIYRLLMSPDDLESLLQERLAGLGHAQKRSLHRDPPSDAVSDAPLGAQALGASPIDSYP